MKPVCFKKAGVFMKMPAFLSRFPVAYPLDMYLKTS